MDPGSLPERMAAGLGPVAGTGSRVSEVPSRAAAALLATLERQDSALTVAALSDATGQHPNTVREHLDALVDAGLVGRSRAEASGRGRPAWLYAVVPAPETAPSEYAGLATALAMQLARTSDDPLHDAAAAGHAWGERLADHSGLRPRTSTAARRGVVRILDDLGFAPEEDHRVTNIRLRRCPLLDAARQQPEVVCSVHLGIARGALDRWGVAGEGTDLVPFAEPGACVLHLGDDRGDGAERGAHGVLDTQPLSPSSERIRAR